MNPLRTPDLPTLIFALSLCAVFGALFAWVLSAPLWLGFSMVGAALFALGAHRPEARATTRRRWSARPSH